LLDDDRHRDFVRRGGVWWRHVQHAKAMIAARRNGDQAKIDQLVAEEKEAQERAMAALLSELR
jgi:hypothetical protein